MGKCVWDNFPNKKKKYNKKERPQRKYYNEAFFIHFWMIQHIQEPSSYDLQ